MRENVHVAGPTRLCLKVRKITASASRLLPCAARRALDEVVLHVHQPTSAGMYVISRRHLKHRQTLEVIYPVVAIRAKLKNFLPAHPQNKAELQSAKCPS